MALEVMEIDGVAGVRVEVLAKRLAISKSGFYWHFKNRDHLLKDMLDHWSHEVTEVISANPEILALKPKDRLVRTAEIIIDYLSQQTGEEVQYKGMA